MNVWLKILKIRKNIMINFDKYGDSEEVFSCKCHYPEHMREKEKVQVKREAMKKLKESLTTKEIEILGL